MSATDTNQDESPVEPGEPLDLADGTQLVGDPMVQGLIEPGAAPPDADDDAARGTVVRSSPWRLALIVLAVVGLGVFVSAPAVIVVVALVFMIFMHELGHFLTARRAGMLVTEFFIGFGPRIWSFQRGEVEYGIKAIPAGAYVRIIGMNNLDQVDPADEPRTYRQQPFWQRFSVAVAGSAMHFLMAFVLLFIVFFGYGELNTRIWSIDEITPSQGLTQNGDPVQSPAEAAGLREGDRILQVDDDRINEFEDLRDAIGSRPGETVTLVVRRDGRTFETTTTLLAQGPDGQAEGFLGVHGDSPRQRLPVITSVQRAGSEFATIVAGSVTSLGHFFSPSGLSNFFDQAVNANDADQQPQASGGAPSEDQNNRIVSIYGAARIGTQATEAGIVSLLFFLALINIFIGVFNLIPLLPLDGGHVAIAVYEKFREWRLGNQRRYFVDVAKLLPITYGVVAVLVSIGVLALYLDIANPINLPN